MSKLVQLCFVGFDKWNYGIGETNLTKNTLGCLVVQNIRAEVKLQDPVSYAESPKPIYCTCLLWRVKRKKKERLTELLRDGVPRSRAVMVML